MFKYAVYIRTEEGYIERMKNVVSNLPYDARAPYGSPTPYVHEEELVGFPESVVLWETGTGASVGIAPIDPRASSGGGGRPASAAPAA